MARAKKFSVGDRVTFKRYQGIYMFDNKSTALGIVISCEGKGARLRVIDLNFDLAYDYFFMPRELQTVTKTRLVICKAWWSRLCQFFKFIKAVK